MGTKPIILLICCCLYWVPLSTMWEAKPRVPCGGREGNAELGRLVSRMSGDYGARMAGGLLGISTIPLKSPARGWLSPNPRPPGSHKHPWEATAVGPWSADPRNSTSSCPSTFAGRSPPCFTLQKYFFYRCFLNTDSMRQPVF